MYPWQCSFEQSAPSFFASIFLVSHNIIYYLSFNFNIKRIPSCVVFMTSSWDAIENLSRHSEVPSFKATFPTFYYPGNRTERSVDEASHYCYAHHRSITLKLSTGEV